MDDFSKALDYLDDRDWQSAHEIVQRYDTRLACWAHGIVHVLEGDDGNARYWYRRAGREFSDPIDISLEVSELRNAFLAER